MRTPDSAAEDTALLEAIDLEVEGELEPARRAALQAQLAGDPALEQERVRSAQLQRLLATSRVAADPELARRVMQALPAAGWEARSPRHWVVPALLFLALLVASLVVVGGAGSAAGLPVAATVSALADSFATAAVAGAGLLGASWRGVGLVVGSLLSASASTLVAALVAVMGINLLVLQMLRRRPRLRTAAAARSRGN
jgi:anti-sigma factor RsiW